MEEGDGRSGEIERREGVRVGWVGEDEMEVEGGGIEETGKRGKGRQLIMGEGRDEDGIEGGRVAKGKTSSLKTT